MKHVNPTLQQLVERDPDFAAKILLHPAQIAHANLVQQLLYEADRTENLAHAHHFQEHLVEETLRVSPTIRLAFPGFTETPRCSKGALKPFFKPNRKSFNNG